MMDRIGGLSGLRTVSKDHRWSCVVHSDSLGPNGLSSALTLKRAVQPCYRLTSAFVVFACQVDRRSLEARGNGTFFRPSEIPPRLGERDVRHFTTIDNMGPGTLHGESRVHLWCSYSGLSPGCCKRAPVHLIPDQPTIIRLRSLIGTHGLLDPDVEFFQVSHQITNSRITVIFTTSTGVSLVNHTVCDRRGPTEYSVRAQKRTVDTLAVTD
ncbi:uncharacterized protein B0H18DRAFT_71159 [Fomitopsis serialis]|uniref:uncharacterized protein n=1 Tax=Fomitopsis serialis TaxID=139415 RepID=UPI0020089D32|nr:uncharacterized protein B0H18DRAFT_71159 [Neoantrodia serialis]KAH9931937.1 hypothetical protein B0H18DRAFT_71159 [Neoantrodia serialis]